MSNNPTKYELLMKYLRSIRDISLITNSNISSCLIYVKSSPVSCDFVELLDSAGQRIEVLLGYKPLYTVRVDGNTTDVVQIRFDSDSSVRRKGFLAQYNIITCK